MTVTNAHCRITRGHDAVAKRLNSQTLLGVGPMHSRTFVVILASSRVCISLYRLPCICLVLFA